MDFDLKRLVSQNIILYTVWFHLRRKHRGVRIKYFSKRTTLYIDGFPRSGNTYLVHLCRNIFPNQEIVHHLHAIAPLKLSLSKNIPSIILFRNPFDAISSRYLKELAMKDKNFEGVINDAKLKQYIQQYISYNKFLVNNIDRIILVNFTTLINEPLIVLSKISDILKISKSVDINDFKKAEKTYRGATDTLGSSKPNPTKEKYKNEIKKHIIEFDKSHTLRELKKELISLQHV